MPTSAVQICKNYDTKKDINSDITFHKFPVNPKMLNRWTEIIRKSRNESWWKPKTRTCICSVHFHLEDTYKTKGGGKRIRSGAVPTKVLTKAKFDETFAIPKKVLAFCKIHMTHDLSEMRAKYWSWCYWLSIINVVLSVLAEIIGILMTVKDATNFQDAIKVFRTLPCLSYCVSAIIKTIKIKHNRATFENLHRELGEMWPTGMVIKEDHNIIKMTKQLNFIVKGYFWCNIALVTSFFVPPAILCLARHLGYDIPKQHIFYYWLPFDQFAPGYFEFVVFNQIIAGIFVSMYNVSWDLLFCVYIAHITMQFELLAERVRKLICVPVDQQLTLDYSRKEIIDHKYTDKDCNKELQEELTNIIMKHRTLIRLSADIEAMFSFGILITVVFSCMIICFCGFCSIMIEKWNQMAYKSFLVTALLQTWILCWYGQKLLDHSYSLSQALYECGWYDGSKKLKTSILFMILRSKKEVRVTAYGFSTVSLSSYSMIIKTSWSYFTLLLKFYARNERSNNV